MHTRMKTFASTAMAVVLASVKTVVNPSVAFAGDIGMSFKDRVAMEMDSGRASNTEVRDQGTIDQLMGRSADTMHARRDGSMIDKAPAAHGMIHGSAVLQKTAGGQDLGVMVATKAMSDDTGQFGRVRH